MKNLLMTTIAIFGLMTVTIAQVPSYVPTDSLKGWWPFNGNANDESGNGNNIAAYGGASLSKDRIGVTKKAYYLDGIDGYLQTNNSCYNDSSNHTISFWFKIEDTLQSTQTFFSAHQKSPETFSFNHFNASKPQKASLFLGTISSWSIVYNHLVTLNNLNNWLNLVYVKNALNYYFYLNGRLIDSLLTSQNLPDYNSPLQFGAAGPDPNLTEYFNGKIDDIGIWNRALDSNEVTKLFQATNCNAKINQSGNNSVLVGDTAILISNSSDPNPKFQWQSDIGSGYINLTNAGQYSGVTDSILIIKNISKNNNNQKFRCFITTDSCRGYSNPTTLTVNCVVTQEPNNTSVQVGDNA